MITDDYNPGLIMVNTTASEIWPLSPSLTMQPADDYLFTRGSFVFYIICFWMDAFAFPHGY